MSRWDRWWCAVWVGMSLTLMACPPLVSADTIRLKDGRTIEGTIVREDESVVVVLIGNRPEFFPASEVVSIARRQPHMIVPRSSPSVSPSLPGEVETIDLTVVDKIRERLRTFNWALKQTMVVLEDVHQHREDMAFRHAEQTAQWVLPTHKNSFSPFSALADLLILLGLRTPTLWLALALVRERRSFTRILEVLMIAYGLLMLLAISALTLLPMVSAWIVLAVVGCITLVGCAVFAWMFALPFQRACWALVLAIGMNLGIEYLLLQTHLL